VVLAEHAGHVALGEKDGSGPAGGCQGRFFTEMRNNCSDGWIRGRSAVTALAGNSVDTALSWAQTAG